MFLRTFRQSVFSILPPSCLHQIIMYCTYVKNEAIYFLSSIKDNVWILSGNIFGSSYKTKCEYRCSVWQKGKNRKSKHFILSSLAGCGPADFCLAKEKLRYVRFSGNILSGCSLELHSFIHSVFIYSKNITLKIYKNEKNGKL